MNNVKMSLVSRILKTFWDQSTYYSHLGKKIQCPQPMRTDTNIRLYDLASLQKLLNITLLHEYGYKISKCSYPEEKFLH
jgi:hypothetical protein